MICTAGCKGTFRLCYYNPWTHHSRVLWLLPGSVRAVLLVVESAGVAEVVAPVVPAPERGGVHITVQALAAVWKKERKQCYDIRSRQSHSSQKDENLATLKEQSINHTATHVAHIITLFWSKCKHLLRRGCYKFI